MENMEQQSGWNEKTAMQYSWADIVRQRGAPSTVEKMYGDGR